MNGKQKGNYSSLLTASNVINYVQDYKDQRANQVYFVRIVSNHLNKNILKTKKLSRFLILFRVDIFTENGFTNKKVERILKERIVISKSEPKDFWEFLKPQKRYISKTKSKQAFHDH